MILVGNDDTGELIRERVIGMALGELFQIDLQIGFVARVKAARCRGRLGEEFLLGVDGRCGEETGFSQRVRFRC